MTASIDITVKTERSDVGFEYVIVKILPIPAKFKLPSIMVIETMLSEIVSIVD